MVNFALKISRKVVRLFNWRHRRQWVMGWHDSMMLDYQNEKNEFTYHYEDGWQMEVKYCWRTFGNRYPKKEVRENAKSYS